MVAVLQDPPLQVPRQRSARSRPARVVPLRAVQSRSDEVHRQPRPQVTRSHCAAVYWRRRFVAAALGLGIALTVAHAGAALGGSATNAPGRSPQVLTVVARPGDTLWSIAERVAPNADPRAVVDALAASHGSSSVQPGDVYTWSK